MYQDIISDGGLGRVNQASFSCNTAEFDLISIRDSNKVYFSKCSFEKNRGAELFNVTPTSRNVAVTSSTFRKNRTKKFINNIKNIEVSDCRFSWNSFRDHKDSFLNRMD